MRYHAVREAIHLDGVLEFPGKLLCDLGRLLPRRLLARSFAESDGEVYLLAVADDGERNRLTRLKIGNIRQQIIKTVYRRIAGFNDDVTFTNPGLVGRAAGLNAGD